MNAGPVATFTCPAVPDCASVGDAEISILESGGAQYLQRASSLPLCMQPGSQGMKGAATPDVGLIAPAVAVMPRRTTRCIEKPRKAVAIQERGRCAAAANSDSSDRHTSKREEATSPSCMDHGVITQISITELLRDGLCGRALADVVVLPPASLNTAGGGRGAGTTIEPYNWNKIQLQNPYSPQRKSDHTNGGYSSFVSQQLPPTDGEPKARAGAR